MVYGPTTLKHRPFLQRYPIAILPPLHLLIYPRKVKIYFQKWTCINSVLLATLFTMAKKWKEYPPAGMSN